MESFLMLFHIKQFPVKPVIRKHSMMRKIICINWNYN